LLVPRFPKDRPTETLVKKTAYVPPSIIGPEVTPDLGVPDAVLGCGRGGHRGPEKWFRDEGEARAWLEGHRGELPGGGLAFGVVRRWMPQPRRARERYHRLHGFMGRTETG